MPSNNPTELLPLRIFILLSLISCGCLSQTSPRQQFKAAVYEHALVLPENPRQLVTRQEALQTMQKNLDIYSVQAAEAKRQGADIIVFPEDGLYGISFTWETVTPYLEYVPDPRVTDWIPCDEPTRFPDTEVQKALSCMAKDNQMYIVANMGDRQPCHQQVTANCNHYVSNSTDQHLQYNTDVAFNPAGKLVARYHKKNLFFEEQFDTPDKEEFAIFDTPFGRWSMFTCFDILFYSPAVEVIEREGIANIAFPTAWMDALPLLSSVQFHSAFARGMGVNFLAANLHLPQDRFQGSGIYTPKGQAAFVHNASVSSDPQLLVRDLQVLEKPQPEGLLAARNILKPDQTSQPAIVNMASDDQFLKSDKNPKYEAEYEFVSELFNDLFNFQQVKDPAGSVRVCSEQVCCYLNYSMTPDTQGSDLFAFGAFDGLHTYEGNYYLQICALVRCANQSLNSCGSPVNQSSTLFHFLSMRGEFQTSYIFPEVLLTTQESYLRLAQEAEWSFFNREIWSETGFSHPLLSAALFGRNYTRDTEWQQSLSNDAVIVTASAMALWRLGSVIYAMQIFLVHLTRL